ncbi:hypothetical protein C479_11060 [Halovivax asiaticus JCM 14624]|uniref:Uncharacterized protein n=1 Tax=Halovivax asiaticus JCM 14624 TaxID=1227490 RepID=M0BEN6_9EURY|nr:hypothetical protein C479_11060 [Halovivax asiaticus JCM 14624]
MTRKTLEVGDLNTRVARGRTKCDRSSRICSHPVLASRGSSVGEILDSAKGSGATRELRGPERTKREASEPESAVTDRCSMLLVG